MTDKLCPLCGSEPHKWEDYMGAHLRKCPDDECPFGRQCSQITAEAWNLLPRHDAPEFAAAKRDAHALEGLALEAIKAFGCHPRELALVTQTSPDGRKTTWRIEKI